ncbi:MAG: type II toxin-antitoxin system VapB family antitoxin [Terriglobia bacterium]
MKTTVEISDALLLAAKKLAHERSTTLREIVEEGLRVVLQSRQAQPFQLRDGSFGKLGMHHKMTWEEIRDEVYQGRGA